MRSYYAHLETTLGQKLAIAARPILRASAIFPIFHLPGISSRILFMGYWMLKRNIKQVAAIVTLRTLDGTVINRNNFLIEEPKCYAIEIKDQLITAGFSSEDSFTGSIEIEFFSTVNLFFPFPAVVINYYGPKFSSVVHTAQRIYNDFDDMHNNSQTDVPESGFNVYADDNIEPFIGLINGPLAVQDCKIHLQFFNHDKEVLSHDLHLGTMAPYQTQMIYPAKIVDLKRFLKGKAGAGKLRFHVNWVFPRLLVGNIDHGLPAITITHTYYDTTGATADSDYWLPPKEGWYTATMMAPIYGKNREFTNLYFYPIYPPSETTIDIEIYNSEGKLLGQKKNALLIKAPLQEFTHIPLTALCKEMNIPSDERLAARIIAHPYGKSRVPARIKLGLDIGQHIEHMPCNICTNLQPFVPAFETKPSTFKWAPILADQPNAAVWIFNSSPAIHYDRTANVKLTFFREKDSQTLTREANILPHGFLQIDPHADQELKTFFDEKVGWFTAVSSNPYTSTYYLAMNPSGVVGGDHGF